MHLKNSYGNKLLDLKHLTVHTTTLVNDFGLSEMTWLFLVYFHYVPWVYAIAYLVWTSVEIPLVYLLCLFYSLWKVETCFDSIKLKVGGKRANGNGPRCIVLLYWYYQGLVPSRSSQVDVTVFLSFSVSKRLCTCFEPFEPYNNTAEETGVKQVGLLEATHESRVTCGPGCLWLLKLPSPHWLSETLIFGPFHTHQALQYIKRITGIKLQPCLGSGTKWKGCVFGGPVQHNEFPGEL